MAPFIDHYAVLEIQFGASADEIKKSWMQLVKQWQSKANSGDPIATERLQQIHEAYEVLSDPEKRIQYDIIYVVEKEAESEEASGSEERQNESFAASFMGAIVIATGLTLIGFVLWAAWNLGSGAWQAIFPADEPPVVVTAQPTATYTPISTATYTPQPSSPTPSPIPTSSPVPTDTPIPAAIPASTPLPTDTPIPTDTPVPTATSTPTYTATPIPTDTPTFTPTPTYTLTPSPVPTDTPTPTPPPADTPVPTPTLTPTPEPTDSAIHSHLTIATPDCDSSGIDSAYLHNLKVGVRELINDARAAEGVPILLLAGSGVSQCHAEDMANNCFTSHWSTNGTKPHVRYATAGYENRVVEIIDGHNYCTQDVDTTDIATRIRDTATRLLEDPEHRQKLVDASNVSLDIGIAADEHRNLWLVIGLASDFIEFDEPPHIDNFEISMHGKIENGARISSTEGLWIEIYYDPLPVPLTRGQLARTTSCVELGEMEARLLRPGPNYIQRSFIVDKPACLNPHQSASGIAPPGSIQGAAELSDHMDIQAANLVSRRHAGLLIVASKWQVSENQDFSVTADLEEVLKRHGNGIYTAAIYALLDDERQIVAEYPMFVTGIE